MNSNSTGDSEQEYSDNKPVKLSEVIDRLCEKYEIERSERARELGRFVAGLRD